MKHFLRLVLTTLFLHAALCAAESRIDWVFAKNIRPGIARPVCRDPYDRVSA